MLLYLSKNNSKLTDKYLGTSSLCFVKSSCAHWSALRGTQRRFAKQQAYPERGERIRRHLKGALVDPVEEVPKHPIAALLPIFADCSHSPCTRALRITVVIEDDGRSILIFQHLS